MVFVVPFIVAVKPSSGHVFEHCVVEYVPLTLMVSPGI